MDFLYLIDKTKNKLNMEIEYTVNGFWSLFYFLTKYLKLNCDLKKKIQEFKDSKKPKEIYTKYPELFLSKTFIPCKFIFI